MLTILAHDIYFCDVLEPGMRGHILRDIGGYDRLARLALGDHIILPQEAATRRGLLRRCFLMLACTGAQVMAHISLFHSPEAAAEMPPRRYSARCFAARAAPPARCGGDSAKAKKALAARASPFSAHFEHDAADAASHILSLRPELGRCWA